jgi:hypothetical protein
MKRKIVALLAPVVMAGALLAGPALARDHDGDDGGYSRSRWHATEEWSEHHPYQAWGNPGWGYGYPDSAYAYRPGRYENEYPGNRDYRWGWQPRHGHGWFHHDRDHDGD